MRTFYEKLNKHAGSLFLILFIGLLLWMSLGLFLQHSLVHNRPTGFRASDSYAWLAYAQSIFDSGSFKYTPPFMNLNLEGFSSPEPPLFMQYTAFLARALGIPVYDAQILSGILLIILSGLIFFVLLEEYDPRLAYLSLPLYIFLFTFPFVDGLLYGVLPAIFGFLFLFATFFMLLHMGLKYSWVVLTVFIAAMIMGHTVRVFELIFFIGAFVLCAFIFKKIDFGFVKKIFISGICSLLISLYYLPMFWLRFSEDKSGSFSFVPSDAADYLLINLGDFGIVKYVISAGLLVCLYFLIKERRRFASLVFIFTMVSFLLILFLRVSKVYQVTFFWPVFLSLAFGSVIFFLISRKWLSEVNTNLTFYVLISACLSLLLVYSYHLPYRTEIMENMFSGTPIPMGEQWKNLVWVSKNIPEDSSVLFFYFSNSVNDDIYHFFPSKRLSFYVPLSEIDAAINKTGKGYNYRIYDNSVAFFYKRDPNIPLRVLKLDKSRYVKNWTICDFDYIYGKRAIRLYDSENQIKVPEQTEKRVLHTIDLINALLKNKNFQIVHQNDEAYVLHNKNPGGDCV